MSQTYARRPGRRNTRFVAWTEPARADRVGADMTPGARHPEELDALLEDALVVGDRAAVAALFDRDAVAVGAGAEARGGDAIARLLGGCRYVAVTRELLRAGDTALVVAERATH